MNNRKSEDRKSGALNTFTMAAVAIAVCVAALMLMPAQAGSEASAASAEVSATIDDNANAVTQAAAGDAGYLPSLYENRAKDDEPVRATY